MTVHELRDEDGNVIHACATASFPLPGDHWIYKEPVEPEVFLELPDKERANVEQKTQDALKYAIQVCTNQGKDNDFDPDAMLMKFRTTLFGIGRSIVATGLLLLFVLCSVPCYGQDSYDYNYRGGYERFGSPTARWSTDPPKIYSGGQYLGELSQNRYRPDSVSNPYGRYGSRYSPTSVNNPYSQYGAYRTQPIYIYPGRW